MLGEIPTCGMAFAAMTRVILTPLVISEWSGSQILHYDCYSLAPCSHLSIGIHDAQPMRKVGTISPLQGLCHHMNVAAQEHGLSLGIYDH